MSKGRILITGINGFIGSACAARWSRSGYYVVGSDIQPTSKFVDHIDEYFQVDLGSVHSADAFARIPAADYVLHSGGISGFMVETNNPRHIFEVNVAGTVAALAYARRVGCRRTILCSSIMVYGPSADCRRELDESEYPQPITVYGGSKLAIEGLMHGWVGQYGVDALALRYSHVYGPGRITECFIREMLQAAADGKPCHVPQASGSLRQYVHIDDICNAIELAMQVKAPSSRIFNISADELQSLAQVADVVRATTGPLQVTFDEERDLPNYRIGKLSIRRARDELGYAPRLTLAKGIQDYWSKAFKRRQPPDDHA